MWENVGMSQPTKVWSIILLKVTSNYKTSRNPKFISDEITFRYEGCTAKVAPFQFSINFWKPTSIICLIEGVLTSFKKCQHCPCLIPGKEQITSSSSKTIKRTSKNLKNTQCCKFTTPKIRYISENLHVWRQKEQKQSF